MAKIALVTGAGHGIGKGEAIELAKAGYDVCISYCGSEEQAKDLIQYIQDGRKQEEGIWQINIFGKTIEELVEDGIRSKLYQIGEESQVKLQDTMQKIVNDSNGGLVCIII